MFAGTYKKASSKFQLPKRRQSGLYRFPIPKPCPFAAFFFREIPYIVMVIAVLEVVNVYI